jgi:hypothetical protein
MIHFTIDLKVLVVTILIGLFSFKKSNPLYLKLLPFFLMLTLSVELTGELLQGPGGNNLLVFNLFSIVEFMYYSWFFKMVTPGKNAQVFIRLTLYLLPVFCLVNIFLVQGPNFFHTYTYCLASIMMVILGILYFYRLFKSDGRLNLLREPAFWMSIGIIFFFTCSVSVIGVINYISTLPVIISKNLQKIFSLVNAFFYILFIIAFLCRINIRKSLSS